MDVLKQLAPYYRKYEELSVENLNEAEFLCSSRSLRTCTTPSLYSAIAISSEHYEELTQSLSSTMQLASWFIFIDYHVDSSYGEMTEEEFDSSLTSLFASAPRPPIHVSAAGPYSCITSVPPILLCDASTLSLYETYLRSFLFYPGFFMDRTPSTV